jgi:6-phosphogluconolactonase
VETETLIADRAELAASFAHRLAREAERMLRLREKFVLAICGGSVAETFVPEFAAARVDWSRVDLLWLDERAVPADHADSNYGSAWRAGLDALPLERARVHRLAADGNDLESAAERAEWALRNVAGAPPRIDLALAGVGADGHVASLFPDHPALEEWTRWVMPVVDSPKPPARRLTVTLPVFAVVDLLVVGAFGAEKADVVRAAIQAPDSVLPIARAARLATRRLLLVDPPAAAKLSR